MNDQVTPEGGALPSGAKATFAQHQAEIKEVEGPKPKEATADSPPAATESEKPAKPPKSGEQVRIDELTRRYREEQRRADRLMKAHEELLQRLGSQQQQPQARQQPAQEKTLKDFNYDEAAYVRHLREQVAASVPDTNTLAAQIREQEAEARRRETFESRVAAFAKANPDYTAVVEGEWACSKPMAEAIEGSEEGPALAYYLAQNPDEAAQMARLSPVQAGRELARLEDRLIAERKKALEKPVSQAPPPAPKIDASDPGNVETSPLKMTPEQLAKLPQEAFNKWRTKTMARRR